jgi:hypothetical protein
MLGLERLQRFADKVRHAPRGYDHGDGGEVRHVAAAIAWLHVSFDMNDR